MSLLPWEAKEPVKGAEIHLAEEKYAQGKRDILLRQRDLCMHNAKKTHVHGKRDLMAKETSFAI
jgi:hypothetical protein